jgi:hypothetical protein
VALVNTAFNLTRSEGPAAQRAARDGKPAEGAPKARRRAATAPL